jgi:diaminopimelate decarboxylase
LRFLISSVIANKRLSDGRRAVVIDAGVNLLFTSFWFKHKVAPGQNAGGFTENSVLYGPLCMNIDCIREEIVLPALKKGELVVIMNTGSYSVTQWMQFISMRPNIVLISEEGKDELIRSNENLDYVSSLERIPEKLKTFNLH